MVSHPDDGDPGDEGSLRAAGWRQGCRLRIELPLQVVVLGAGGRPAAEREVHGEWAVATQDCDLARISADANDGLIELRPLVAAPAGAVRGVRSQKFVLVDGLAIEDHAPRILVAPSVLSLASQNGGHAPDECPERNQRRALKTWLGLRYDRPAVPGPFLACQAALAKQLSKPKLDEAHLLRDVLVAYAYNADGAIVFDLVAVLPGDRDVTPEQKEALEAWLASAVLAVPTDAGVARRVEVLPATRVSIDFIERSFAVTEARDVTWPRRGGGPVGEATP
jgi:hypothetical protein